MREELNTFHLTPQRSDHLQRDNTVPQFHPRVVNLSRVRFNHKEDELLSRGFKFVLPPQNRKKASVNVIADSTVKVGVHHSLLRMC